MTTKFSKFGVLAFIAIALLLAFRKLTLKSIAAAIGSVFFVVGIWLTSYRNIKEIPSPHGTYILTVYDAYGALGFQGGQTVFNLRRANEPMFYLRNSYRTFERIVRENDVAIVDGNYYPYKVAWRDDRHLLVCLKIFHGFFEKSENRWGDVAVSYSDVDRKKYSNEVLLDWRR